MNEDILVRCSWIAEKCNAAPNHIAHVVNRLQAEGFVETVRGRSGGVRLARPSTKISIGAVFRVFEADIPLAECFAPEGNTCPLVVSCRLRNYLVRALDAFYHELDLVTLEDLVRGNCGLEELLVMPETLTVRCSP